MRAFVVSGRTPGHVCDGGNRVTTGDDKDVTSARAGGANKYDAMTNE
jgi:hypothetical protein